MPRPSKRQKHARSLLNNITGKLESRSASQVITEVLAHSFNNNSNNTDGEGEMEVWETLNIPEEYMKEDLEVSFEKALEWYKNADESIKIRARYDGTSTATRYRRQYKRDKDCKKMTDFYSAISKNNSNEAIEDYNNVEDTEYIINVVDISVEDEDDANGVIEIDEIDEVEDSRRQPLDVAQMKLKIRELEKKWMDLKPDMGPTTARQKFSTAKYDDFRYGSLVFFFKYCCEDNMDEVVINDS
jgi:hypothetical protein